MRRLVAGCMHSRDKMLNANNDYNILFFSYFWGGGVFLTRFDILID